MSKKHVCLSTREYVYSLKASTEGNCYQHLAFSSYLEITLDCAIVKPVLATNDGFIGTIIYCFLTKSNCLTFKGLVNVIKSASSGKISYLLPT